MANEYRSTALYYGNCIDCRALTFAFEFYQLSFNQLTSLALDIFTWLETIIDDRFVAKWYLNDKAVRCHNFVNQLQQLPPNRTVDFTCEGFVKSPLIFNSSSTNKYRSYVQRGIYSLQNVDPRLSIDYRTYWNSLFPNGRIDSGEIPPKIAQTFHAKNRQHNSVYIMPDIQVMFFSHQYTAHPGLYYGSFAFNVGFFCFVSSIDVFADMLVSKMVEIAATYHQLNARVMLQPIYNTSKGHSPYMRYFGTHYRTDNSHTEVGCTPKEWYETYYVCGVEWANVISPLAKKHLSWKTDDTVRFPDVVVQSIPGGCTLVKSNKTVEKFDVDDSLNLKRLLYPALFPGGCSFSLRRLFEKDVVNAFMASFPRSDWANVPVFDEEISIVGTDLVISSNYFYGQ